MPEVIIADTSCLIILYKSNELRLLRLLYGQITVTSVIAAEYGYTLPDWVKIRNAINKPQDTISKANIDPGEASAINLALENTSCLLIIDDLKARKLAQKLHLVFTGTIGIILQAKLEGYIISVQDMLTKIRATNFYISEELAQKILKVSGESE